MNVELAMDALADAKAYRDRFNMNVWSETEQDRAHEDDWDYEHERVPVDETHLPPCGTTACYAGFIAFRLAPVGSQISGGMIYYPDGEQAMVSELAQAALGITDEQADVIFLILGTLEQVERAVAYLADNPGADMDSIYDAARLEDR